MLGLATGPYQTFSLNGPAARVYLRQPVSASPLAGRLDLEVSRMTARDLDPAFYRVVDSRVTAGMEYGVPLDPQVELAVVGSVGVARQTTELSIDLGAPANAPSNVSYKQSDWSLAYDVGIGAKLGRRFHAAFHFFSSDGAPYRLYLGVRL